MKWIALILGALLCLFEIVVVIVYFIIFNGGISINNQDWSTFSQILNGCVMAVLTGINIWIFYKISNSIEENTENRAAKQTLFEAQLVITQMRVKWYEELSQLINDIKVDLSKLQINESNIDQLKKKLMKIDQSFLFKNDILGDSGFLFPLSEEILNLIKERKEGYIDKLQDKLTSLMSIMELYIITQMLRDHEVAKYINSHKGDIDSTFSCMDQFAKEFNKSIVKDTSF